MRERMSSWRCFCSAGFRSRAEDRSNRISSLYGWPAMAALEEQKMTMKQTLFPALAMGALTLSTISAYAKGPAPVTVSLKTAQGADAGTVVLRQEKGFVT